MGMHGEMKDKLDTNVTSIVIGALIVIVIASWAKFIRSLHLEIANDTEDRFNKTKEKFLSAFILTIISIVAIIIIYEIWKLYVF